MKTTSIHNVLDSLVKKVDTLKSKYDPTISLQDPKLKSILTADYKNITLIKKEMKEIEENLKKDSSIDIFRIYQKEFEKYFKEFKNIQKKYIYLKAVTDTEKKYYEQNKEDIKKVTQTLNTVEVISDNLKKIIIDKCKKYGIPLEVKNVKEKKETTTEIKTSMTRPKIDLDIKPKEKNSHVDLLKILKNLNKQIDDIHKSLVIDDENTELNLYSIKEEIITLKKQYQEYKVKLIQMKHHPNFEAIDTNKLLLGPKAIDTLLTMCNEKIELKKEAIVTDIPVSKILLNHKKEVKEKEKYIVTLKEKSLISSSLNEDLKHCNEELSKIRNFVNRANVKLRKRAFLNGFASFIKNMERLSFSMFPVVLFQNKQIGTLTSCMLVNNRIRMARKIVSDEKKEMIYMEYNKIENQLGTKVNCYATIKNVLDNSLDQLNKLTMETESKFHLLRDDQVVIEMNKSLDRMKSQLENMKNQINEEYQEEKELDKKKKSVTM